MRFEIGDRVVCGERPGRFGRVLRLRVGVGLIEIQWSKHVRSWHCDETVQRVEEPENRTEDSAVFTATRTANESASKNSMNLGACDSLLSGQVGHRWYGRLYAESANPQRELRIQESRERDAENEHGKRAVR